MTLAIANIASITAPMLSGWLAQHHGYGAMFLATAVVSFCSMLCMTLLQPERKIGADSSLHHRGIQHAAQR
jgi:predicted MFS family arabinose efflux permease